MSQVQFINVDIVAMKMRVNVLFPILLNRPPSVAKVKMEISLSLRCETEGTGEQ